MPSEKPDHLLLSVWWTVSMRTQVCMVICKKPLKFRPAHGLALREWP